MKSYVIIQYYFFKGYFMLNNILKVFIAFFILFSQTFSYAETTPTPKLNQVENTFHDELLNKLVQEGFITNEQNKTIHSTIIPKLTKQSNVSNSSEKSFFNLINMVKILAILILLYTFRGLIILLSLKFHIFLMMIPMFVYQLFVFSLTILATFYPQIYYSSHTFYIQTFGALSNIIVVSWIYYYYRKNTFIEKITVFFQTLILSINKNLSFVEPLLLLLIAYLSSFTFILQSQTFGLFTLISALILTFYCLSSHINFNNIQILHNLFQIFCLSLVVIFFKYFDSTNLFYNGFVYVMPIVLGILSLILINPFLDYKSFKNFIINIFIFILYILLTFFCFSYNFTVFASILSIFILLTVFINILYFSIKIHSLFATAIFGITLYLLASTFENYSHIFIFIK